MTVTCFENLKVRDNGEVLSSLFVIEDVLDGLGFFTFLVFVLTVLSLEFIIRMLFDLFLYYVLMDIIAFSAGGPEE